MTKSLYFILLLIVFYLYCAIACGISYGQEESWEAINARVTELHGQKKYQEALPLAEKCLALARKSGDDVRTAHSLNNLAFLYEQQKRYAEAEPLYKEALQIRRRVLGTEHRITAMTLNNLARLYEAQKRYAEAEPLYREVMEIRKKVLGPRHSDTASALNNLAMLYKALGRGIDAEPLLLEALDIKKEALGAQHLETAVISKNLADLYMSQGRYRDAEPLLESALEIRKKVFGAEHPDTASIINNLAFLYKSQGRYTEAEILYIRALEIYTKALGPQHPDTALIYNNLAGLYESLGRYTEAEPCYKYARDIDMRAFGPNHPETASTINNLAYLYKSQGRYAMAEALYRETLAIYTRTIGLQHADAASVINNLAALYKSQGRLSDAGILYAQSLEIRRKVLGPEHPDTASSLNNLAALYVSEGRFSDAEPLLKSALEIKSRILGPDHPDTASIINNQAILYASRGRTEEAFRLMQKSLSIEETIIEDVFRCATEKRTLEFIMTVQDYYETFLSLTVRELRERPEALTAGLNTVLRRKGMIIEALSQKREALMTSDTAEVRSVCKKLQELSSLLASLTLAGPGKMEIEQYRKKLAKLSSEREFTEWRLAGLSLTYADQKEARLADCSKVAEKLPPGSVLIEYVTIAPFNFNAKGPWGRSKDSECYAFVLPSAKDRAPGGTIHPLSVSLGSTSVIDRAIQEFRKEISRTRTMWENNILNESEAEERLAKKGKALYDLVVSPLKSAVGTARTLYIAPDGGLNLIPFGSLKDETGHYMIENYRIHYLSSGKDLISRKKEVQNRGPVIVFADPEYDAPGAARRPDAPSLQNWRRLPGTGLEAEGIIKELGADRTLLYTGRQALEEVAKKLKSPYRVHFATHGFFMDGSFSPGRIENTLIGSGIVLAGAGSKPVKGRDDGILTALEISGIPLYGTDLVVLSACETGVGEILCGEGVFGLRRVFQLAGARTVVMSLWSVPDDQTRELMVDYYRRMKRGEGKSEALRNAELAIMAARRKAQGAAHPFFWSAFISAGEP